MIEYITLSDLVKKVSQDAVEKGKEIFNTCLLYTSPSPRDRSVSRMPSSA